MAVVQFKRMNWFQKVPIWKYNEAWRRHHAEQTGKFLDTTTAAINSFASASIGQMTGNAEIAARTAVDRVQAAVNAKAAQQSQAAASQLVNLLA
jgi:hypothetical protein